MNYKNFTYDSENHIGYNSKGEIIPSVTQLLNIIFPMGDINESVLKNASERGTHVHTDIENYNKGLIETCETIEGRNFVRLMDALDLEIVASELPLVLYDESGEPILYGTTDLILKSKDNDLIIDDIKTVCKFDNEKVSWQLNLYKYIYEHYFKRYIDELSGTWLRGLTAQYRPLTIYDNDIVEKRLFELIKLWKEGKR